MTTATTPLLEPGATSYGAVAAAPAREAPTCAICLGDVTNDELALNCAHVFHNACVEPWLSSNNTCPTCRSAQSVAPAAPQREFRVVTIYPSQYAARQGRQDRCGAGFCCLIFVALAIVGAVTLIKDDKSSATGCFIGAALAFCASCCALTGRQ